MKSERNLNFLEFLGSVMRRNLPKVSIIVVMCRRSDSRSGSSHQEPTSLPIIPDSSIDFQEVCSRKPGILFPNSFIIVTSQSLLGCENRVDRSPEYRFLPDTTRVPTTHDIRVYSGY